MTILILLMLMMAWLLYRQTKEIKDLKARMAQVEARVKTAGQDFKEEAHLVPSLDPHKKLTTPQIEMVSQGNGLRGQGDGLFSQEEASDRPGQSGPSQPHSPLRRDPETKAVTRGLPSWLKDLLSLQSIITKLGALLVLMGVGYLFKYGYDQGYISEGAILLLTGVIGASLGFLSNFVIKKKRHILGHILMGLGVAIIYMTVFAAYQLYDLLPFYGGFIFMIITTLGAFAWALVYDSRVMAILAVMGGLLTPFAMDLTNQGMIGLGLYIGGFALLGTSLYFVKKWRLVQAVTIGSVLLVLGFLFNYMTYMTPSDKVGLGILMTFCLLLFNGVDYYLLAGNKLGEKWVYLTEIWLAVLPLMTVLALDTLFDLKSGTLALLLLLVALVYMGLTTWFYSKLLSRRTSSLTLALMALWILLSILSYFEGQILTLILVFVTLMFYTLSKRVDLKICLYLGHGFYGLTYLVALGYWLDESLSSSPSPIEILVRSLMLLGLIGSAMLNKGMARKIIGSLAFYGYGLPVLLTSLYQLNDPLSFEVTLIVAVIYLGFVHFINDRFSLIFKVVSGIVIGGIGLLKWVMTFVFAVFNDYDWGIVLAFLISGFLLYGIGILRKRKGEMVLGSGLRMLAYMIAFITLLFDAYEWHGIWQISLLASLVFLYLIQKLEEKEGLAWSKMVTKGSLFGFCVIILISLLPFSYRFHWYEPLLDLLILLLTFYVLGIRFKKLPERGLYSGYLILMMIAVYADFQALANGQGVITLIWAAVALLVMTYFVKKEDAFMIRVSLGLLLVTAAKFVFNDLRALESLWKILISMGLGSALLVLSYFLQPLIGSKHDKTNP